MSRRDYLSTMRDPRRDIYKECGYPATQSLMPDGYKDLYERNPVATRVVQCLPKESWQVTPVIYEDEDPDKKTKFEQALESLNDSLRGQSWFKSQEGRGSILWDYLLRADILSGVSHFGVLLLGIDDGRNLQEPVEGSATLNGSYMTDEQEKALRNMDSGVSQVWNPKNGNVEERKCSPLTEEEKRIIDNWKQERLFVLNAAEKMSNGKGKLTLNSTGDVQEVVCHHYDRKITKNSYHPMVAAHLTEGEATTNDRQSAKQSSKTADRSFTGKQPPADEVMGRQSPYPDAQGYDTKKGAYPGDIQWPPGRPYADDPRFSLGNAPGTSLAGTDQQYFGVQFGPSEKVGQGSTHDHKLLFLRPFDESLVQIVRYEWDVRNPRFGQPTMYRITLNDPREQHSGIGLPMATVFVHWSRVIHLADNLNSSEIFGAPRMRPVLNRLLDLDKLFGSSAEGYWQGMLPPIVVSSHPQLGGDVTLDPNLPQTLQDMMNHLQRWLALSGATASTLQTAVQDATSQINAQLEAIGIQLAIPIRVLKGSERGELASSQDDAKWNDVLRHRQDNYITPRIIVPFIDRLILLGVLPKPKQYYVVWPDMDSETDVSKAQIAVSRAQAMATYNSGGLENIMELYDFYTRVLGMSHEEAETVIKKVKGREDEDRFTPTQSREDVEEAQQQQEQQQYGGVGEPSGPNEEYEEEGAEPGNEENEPEQPDNEDLEGSGVGSAGNEE
jgi:hypothetical protein